ncbi:MAG: hypothetical protein GF365_01920 [Candidatus Buchananbacteria bacterium]|nr:hypothetical protein [Candidatus Buchananbacteria bacterium]
MAKQKKQQDKESKEVIMVEPKPVEEKKEPTPSRVDNIRIDRIGNLTLNMVAKPLKKRYEKHYKTDKTHLIIDIVLAAIILILLGVILNLWFFSKNKLVNLIDFQVTTHEVINGQEAEFIINYTNTTDQTLTDVNLVLKKPASLHQPKYSTTEFNTKTNTLKIGDLAPNAHGQFKITGFLLGNLDTSQEFLAVMNYKNKYGQERQEFWQKEFNLNGSALQTEMFLPNKAIATSPFEAKLNIKNSSEITFDNLQIKISWPEQIKLISTELGKANQSTWTIGNYKPNQENTYSFIAKAYVNKPQNLNLTTDFYATYDNEQYLLAQAQNLLWVDFSKVTVNFTNLENNLSVSPGQQTTYTINYKNSEDYTITNLEIGLSVKGDYAKQSLIKVNQNDYQQLAELESGQSASIQIPLTTKSIIDFSQEQGNYNLEVRAVASYDDPIEKSRITVESKPIITAVNSNVSLQTTGLFYTPQGDQIGVGSVPPAVGEYTSYWTLIKVINTNNAIKDLKITAQIPAAVEFADIYNVTEGNQIVYNAENNTITWTIGDIERFAGIFRPAPEARIQLAIIPSAKQAGASPALLTNITATATDAKTGAFLTASGKNITTAIFSEEELNKVIQ